LLLSNNNKIELLGNLHEPANARSKLRAKTELIVEETLVKFKLIVGAHLCRSQWN
jgi:hypothetical protein